MHMKFTDEQQQIFEFVSNGTGHGIIDAVAGAGKTTTIMESARFIGGDKSALFCAFNKSIASEISRRFRNLGINEITVKTIHALGWQMIRSHKGDSIQLEEQKVRNLLRNKEVQQKLEPFIAGIFRANDLDPNDEMNERNKFAVKDLHFKIDTRLLDINQKFRATLTENDINEFGKMVTHFGIFNDTEIRKARYRQELEAYFQCHKILLEEANRFSDQSLVFDFTDMLYLPVLWNLNPATKFDFLFIDECQDLSKAQFAVALKYAKKSGRVLAVGDPQQSIYGFTGADIDSYNRVKEKTNAKELPLTLCFRCPRKVIDLAKFIRKDISGVKEEVGIVSIIESDQVVAMARPDDLIISRIRKPLLLLVFNFIDRDIRVQIDQEGVTEIITEIKSIFKPNELNVKIVNHPGEFASIKNDVLDRWNWIIKKNAERIINPTERLEHIVDERRYLEEKLLFLEKKYSQWKDECPTLLDILKRIKDYISATENAIKLSTIHRAKGLENDRVFILDYDSLPFYRLEQKDWERVQEINLKYVALTRSRAQLFLVNGKKEDEDEGSLFDTLSI